MLRTIQQTTMTVHDRLRLMPALRSIRYDAMADQLRPPTESERLRQRKIHLRAGYLATRFR